MNPSGHLFSIFSGNALGGQSQQQNSLAAALQQPVSVCQYQNSQIVQNALGQYGAMSRMRGESCWRDESRMDACTELATGIGADAWDIYFNRLPKDLRITDALADMHECV